MINIEQYKMEAIFSSNDYALQASKLKQKIQIDINKLPKKMLTEDDMWNSRNFYYNLYIFMYLQLQDVYSKAIVASLRDNATDEEKGWFIYPRSYRYILGNNVYATVDEYNVAVYTEYFERTFTFKLNEGRVNNFFEETKFLFKQGYFYGCACALFPIIEFYSRKLSGYNGNGKYTNSEALNKIIELIPQYTLNNGVKTEFFVKQYENIKNFLIKNYYKSSKQTDKEPDFICRNRLLHGILTRDINSADCLRLFHIVRSFVYLDNVLIICNKILEYSSIVLQLEDRIVYGEEEWIKMQKEINDWLELKDKRN